MVRVSPGSPSQWIATCSPCPASTCRSTQFTATFNSPSANHFACGASDQSSTWVNGVAQVNRFACSAQNAIGSAAARSYASADRFAFAANSADGGNVRSSVPKLSNPTAPLLCWSGMAIELTVELINACFQDVVVGVCRRIRQFRGKTGSTACFAVAFMTPAIDPYQARTAVSSPR